MNKLKKCMQNDLDHISNKIDEGYSNKDIIIQNIDFVLSVAEDQHIKLRESNTISKYIDEYVDDENCATDEYIDNYHKYKDLNVDLTNVGKRINDEYAFKLVDPRFKKKVNINESIKIVGDFFKIYDRDIYDYYENFIINGKFFIVKRIFEIYGLSSVSDELLEPYLFLKNSNTIRDMTVIAHEMIHIYLSEKDKYINDKEALNIYVNGVNEVYSHYIEYILLDYLSSINYYSKDIINYKKSLYSELIEHLSNYYVMLEPFDIDFTSYDEVVLHNELKEYSYGLFFLYHFYDQYLLNHDTAKENITNFMLDSKDKEFGYLVNNYGLSEDNLRDYNVILKHVKKIY